MTSLREDIEEKLAIRQFARENMDEPENADEPKHVEVTVTNKVAKLPPDMSEKDQKDLKIRIARIEESAVQSGYWELKSNHRVVGPLIVFAKRAVRKIQHILMGWYIDTLLEHQTRYNQQNVAIMKNVDKLLEIQRNQLIQLEHLREDDISRLERLQVDNVLQLEDQINRQQAEIKELKEQLEIQREEYLIMFQYSNKIN